MYWHNTIAQIEHRKFGYYLIDVFKIIKYLHINECTQFIENKIIDYFINGKIFVLTN